MTRSPRELASQKLQLRKQQEKLFKDLLSVLDNLDHACEHWQKAQEASPGAGVVEAGPTLAGTKTVEPETVKQTHVGAPGSSPVSGWQQIWSRLTGLFRSSSSVGSAANEPGAHQTDIAELVNSAAEGVTMIRQSMLETLQQNQVVPLEAMGKPFDPEKMYALGQQVDRTVPPNTVIQEVVRGYLWQGRVLREAQVIVGVSDTGT